MLGFFDVNVSPKKFGEKKLEIFFTLLWRAQVFSPASI